MVSTVNDFAVLGERRHYAMIIMWAIESARVGDDAIIERLRSIDVDCSRHWPPFGAQTSITGGGNIVYFVAFAVEPLIAGITAGQIRAAIQTGQPSPSAVVIFDGDLWELPEGLQDAIDVITQPIPFIDSTSSDKKKALIIAAVVVVLAVFVVVAVVIVAKKNRG